MTKPERQCWSFFNWESVVSYMRQKYKSEWSGVTSSTFWFAEGTSEITNDCFKTLRLIPYGEREETHKQRVLQLFSEFGEFADNPNGCPTLRFRIWW